MVAGMKQSQLDRELENVLGEIIKYIGKCMVRIGKGILKLNKIKNVLYFLLTIIISILVFRLRPILYQLTAEIDMPVLLQKLVYIILLSTPLVYLGLLGGVTDKEQEKYNAIFREINFKGKDGKYPLFLERIEDDMKRTVYKFHSTISLGEWRKSQEKIETALDCTILSIDNVGSKKVIKVVALSSDYKLPSLILWEDRFSPEKESCLAVGESVGGQVSFDLNSTPHVLVAGETGSGKSVILHVCLWEMILKKAKVYMLDFKGGVEFGLDYEQYGQVITDREDAAKTLEELVLENMRRLELFRTNRAKNISEYNQKTGSNLCRIGVFCDEIAEMLDTTGVPKEEKVLYEKIKGSMSTLARLSRSTGINLIVGVQRPDANVLTGQIKNNIPVRICGRFADKAASEIVLNSTAAINLPETKGRFLFLRGNELVEFQAYLFKDEMMHEVEQGVGEMLIESKRTKKEQETKNDKNVEPKQEVVDYGLDRYSNSDDFNFSYNDDQIEWGVDK